MGSIVRTVENVKRKISKAVGIIVMLGIMGMCVFGIIDNKNKIENSIEVEAYVSNVTVSSKIDDEDRVVNVYNSIVEYSINGQDISNEYESRSRIEKGDTIKIHILKDDPSTITHIVSDDTILVAKIMFVVAFILFIIILKCA